MKLPTASTRFRPAARHTGGVFGVAVVACALPWWTACADTSPVSYTPDTDAGRGDAAASINVARVEACRRCLQDDGAPCADEYRTCAADEDCKALIDCETDTDCFSHPLTGNLNELPECLQICGDRVGIVGTTHPTVIKVTPSYLCATDRARCAPACVDTPD